MRHKTQTVDDPPQPLGLNTSQAAVYTALLRLQRARSPEVAEAVDQPEERVEPELRALLKLGVVDAHDGRYLARHPTAALSPLIAPKLERIAREIRQIEQLLASIGMLARHYDVGQDFRTGGWRSNRMAAPRRCGPPWARPCGRTKARSSSP
jgi:Predicted transcriptional regulators